MNVMEEIFDFLRVSTQLFLYFSFLIFFKGEDKMIDLGFLVCVFSISILKITCKIPYMNTITHGCVIRKVHLSNIST